MSSVTFTPAMRYSSVTTAIVRGTTVEIFSVDTVLSPGFPKFIISARADTQFMQAPARIKTVFASLGFTYPKGKIITNIVHNTQKLYSQECDFALAISLLIAQDYAQAKIKDCVFIGTLGLDGTILATKGTLAILGSLRYQRKYVFVSSALKDFLLRYPLWKDMVIIPVESITQVCEQLNSQVDLIFYALNKSAGSAQAELSSELSTQSVELASRKNYLNFQSLDSSAPRGEGNLPVDSPASIWQMDAGHVEAKQQLILSAVGAHHAFIYGPCGVGKTTLAQSLVHILPDMDAEELLCRDIYRDISVEDKLSSTIYRDSQSYAHDIYQSRPEFIKPVTKLTYSQVFGGKYPYFEPGYIHLASHGILFFDECTYIAPSILEAMRILLDEQKYNSVSGVQSKLNFQLILAANTCACGSAYPQQCLCSMSEKRRYRTRLSYAFLDRIDIHIQMLSVFSGANNSVQDKSKQDNEYFHSVESKSLSGMTGIMGLREKVSQARERSYARWKIRSPNARISEQILRENTQLSLNDQEFLHKLIRERKFSSRTYLRILALAWSIADVLGSSTLNHEHIRMACELKEPW